MNYRPGDIMATVAAVPGLVELMRTPASVLCPLGNPYQIPNPPTTAGTAGSGFVGGGSHARPGKL